MSHVASTSDAQFDDEVLHATGPVLVEFTASWCPPCKALAPVLADVAAQRSARLRVVALDIDQNPVITQRLSVQSVPTLILFNGGSPMRRLVGYMPTSKLLHEVDKALEGLGDAAA